MKDENNGKIMLEFIDLRSKMYSFRVHELNNIEDKKTIKKAKGVKTSGLKFIKFEDYFNSPRTKNIVVLERGQKVTKTNKTKTESSKTHANMKLYSHNCESSLLSRPGRGFSAVSLYPTRMRGLCPKPAANAKISLHTILHNFNFKGTLTSQSSNFNFTSISTGAHSPSPNTQLNTIATTITSLKLKRHNA
ncbi:hypothetical protein TcasGA2_TC016008 [Tribolium castaneum]|uniref:Uncharacterized protein n=1 Tax=Tribolium castaneum TaxID=7070 RepID=D7ELB8_TRICA|nr:hypothetical protein TcasGA2_TC016008 [Tribolium castaneum]